MDGAKPPPVGWGISAADLSYPEETTVSGAAQGLTFGEGSHSCVKKTELGVIDSGDTGSRQLKDAMLFVLSRVAVSKIQAKDTEIGMGKCYGAIEWKLGQTQKWLDPFCEQG